MSTAVMPMHVAIEVSVARIRVLNVEFIEEYCSSRGAALDGTATPVYQSLPVVTCGVGGKLHCLLIVGFIECLLKVPARTSLVATGYSH